ncbi:MAG: late competence development ComFB family protein [Candidatus Omnitrophota bacterium]
MEIKNYMEFVVQEAVERILEGRKDLCGCGQCKMDIMALVLNRVPPRYIVTNKGRIMTKISETEIQFQVDVIREIVVAVEIVRMKPRHQKQE